MRSKLILGTVQLGLNYGINNKSGKVSINECNIILTNSYNSGIKTLDTAEIYGDAHKIIGDFHRRNNSKRFDIITKFPKDIKIQSIEDKVYNYIEVLAVNHIEVLMFHSFESYKSNKDYLNLLMKLKLKGIINHIGVSLYNNEDIESILDDNEISIVQLPFNLLDNISLRGELISKLKQRGKIVHTRSAFLQGLFFKNLDDTSTIVQELSLELAILNNIKEKLNCSIEQLALAYCLQQKNIDNVIIGVDSSFQLNYNFKASKYTLDKSFINLIDNINVKNIDLLNPTMWKN
jgi:aryl-alcohol dehydrogenase-like predicted oxidoreductase